MSDFIKRRVALCKAIEETIKKMQKKGEETKEFEAASDVIKKELLNPHTKDEVMDSLTLVFETLNKSL